MAYEILKFSKSKVDYAGRLLASDTANPDETDSAFEVVANWRSVHAYPLNTITMDLRQKVNRVYPEALVVQRLKRTRSILAKLTKEPSMRLSQMQDIGGCRAVVENINDVYDLVELYKKSRSLHTLINLDDYIAKPKPSGYRSVHLIYKFKSRSHPEYDNLSLEIQIRTRTQHAWATAVETVGAVIGEALKSSEGQRDWLVYFQNAAIALEYSEQPAFAAREGISLGDIARNLSSLDKNLKVHKKLTAYRAALKETENLNSKSAGYFLLLLIPDQPELKVISFSKRNAELAYREYERYERLLPLHPNKRQLSLFPELSDYSGAQAVLVGADSFGSIRESYPNYYLDTADFLEKIETFVKRYRRYP